MYKHRILRMNTLHDTFQSKICSLQMKNEVREYLIGNVEAFRNDVDKEERKKAMELIQRQVRYSTTSFF